MIYNSSQFNLIPYTTGNCFCSGSDDEKWGALSTMRAKQFCTCWSLDKSALAMLFRSELQ